MTSTLQARRTAKARSLASRSPRLVQKAYVQPSINDVHVNRPLTNISVAFMQDAEGWVASKVFPMVPVEKKSDRYFLYQRDAFNRHEMRERAPATESAGGTYTIDNTPTYFARTYSFHRDIPDDIRGNADVPLNLDREATEYLTLKQLLLREKVWAANYFVTGVWSNEYAGVAGTPAASQFQQWDQAASKPIENVRFMRTATKLKGGIRPNTLVLGRYVWDALMDHPDIIARLDRGQTTGPAQANMDALAALFEIDQILVMDAIENTALEGGTESNAFIGGKHALLVYAAPTPGIMTPTAGYTFVWTGAPGASGAGTRITKIRAPLIRSDRLEIDDDFDMKVVSADLGFMFLNAVA